MYYVSSHLLTGPKGSRLRVAGGDLANMVEYMQPVKVEENNFWHMRQVLKTQRKKVVQTPTLLPGTVFADISTGSLAPRSGGIVLNERRRELHTLPYILTPEAILYSGGHLKQGQSGWKLCFSSLFSVWSQLLEGKIWKELIVRGKLKRKRITGTDTAANRKRASSRNFDIFGPDFLHLVSQLLFQLQLI